jgi:hypothetical protein
MAGPRQEEGVLGFFLFSFSFPFPFPTTSNRIPYQMHASQIHSSNIVKYALA